MITRKKKIASISRGIPQNLSALSFACRLTKRAARLGFDWPDLTEVLKKMDEELAEFREALAQPPHSLGGVAKSRSSRVARPVRPPHPLGGVAKSRSLHVATPPLRDRKRIAEEFGDLLFVLVNVARFLRIDPEAALKRTIRKFNSRFLFVETSLRQKGKSLRQSNLDEMDWLWEEAKRRKNRRKVKVEDQKNALLVIPAPYQVRVNSSGYPDVVPTRKSGTSLKPEARFSPGTLDSRFHGNDRKNNGTDGTYGQTQLGISSKSKTRRR